MPSFDPGSGDSVARLTAVFLALATMGSEPLGHLWPIAGYGLLLFVVARRWQIPAWRVWRQPFRVAPLLVILAVGLPVSRVFDSWFAGKEGASQLQGDAAVLAVSMFLRAFLAVALLNVLIQASGWDGLLRAFRRLGLPAGISLTLAQLERYRQLIASEWKRTMMAREARSPGGHRFALASYSGQVGMVFLRSWERSERIHAAMLARGFTLDGPATFRMDATRLRPIELLPEPLWLPVCAGLIRIASFSLGGPHAL